MAKKSSFRSTYPHVLIRASAGTGKTFQLSNRYIGLLHAEAPGDTILASTFTRKAASEILERVILRLAHAALEEQECVNLAKFLGTSSLTRQRCLELTQRLTRQLHRVRISTFDSFFGQIARTFSLELGFPPGWEIVDTFEDDILRDAAIARVLDLHKTSDLSTLMNLMTKGEATRGVSEVLRGIVKDLYELFQETDAAAWHSITRSKPLPEEKLAALLQELAVVELPTKQMQTGRNKDLLTATSGDWESFIESGMANKVLNGVHEYYKKPIPDEAVSIYERLLIHAKAELVGRVAMQTEATYELLFKFDLEYQQLKRERGALRFDDVTRRVAVLAETFDSAEVITTTNEITVRATPEQLAYRLDSRVQHLLLDEFQDTSPTQWRAIRPMALRAVDPKQNGTFFCVGDVKQAIYGWRGGVAEIFDAITNEIGGIETKSLDNSYRSSPVIIETVNRVFTEIIRHTNLEQTETAIRAWHERFTNHTTAKMDLPGYACLLTAPAKDDETSDADLLLEFAAQHIADLVRESPGASVGVLVRKNDTVGRLIHALRQRQVHASEEGGNPLTDSAAVQLLLSLLRIADHPGDSVARFHVVHSPLAAALNCASLDKETSAFFAQRIRRELLDRGYGPLLYEWTKLLVPHCNKRELSRLMQLVDLGYGYQPQATLRTDDFIDYVEQQRVADPSAADVRVMTVHQAKGLEFDIVVLPELDFSLTGQPDSFVVHRDTPTSPVTRVVRYTNQNVQQLLPEPIQKMFDAAKNRTVAEALCVLYVALTRAVHALHLIIAPSKDSEKKMPRTYAGLLRAALVGESPVSPLAKPFQLGDPHWFRVHRAKTPAPIVAAPQNVPTTPQTISLAPITDRRRRGLERVAPSGLEGWATIRLADMFAGGNAAALVRGTLIHAWFEAIEWLDDRVPDDAALRQIALEKVADLNTHSLNLDDQIRQFRAMLTKPEVMAALQHKSYESTSSLGFDERVAQSLKEANAKPKVLREHNFAVRDNDQLVAGSIDRLVLLYAGEKLVAADILDFKTDSLPAAEQNALDKKLHFYRPQLHAYRDALSKMTGLPLARIATRLVFVSAGIVRAV